MSEFPSAISFLEGFGVDRVSDLDVIGRWQKSNAIKSLAVPIGVTEDGEIFSFNIGDSAYGFPGMGYHGMIAGIAGSGKTELLKTFLLSLAVNFSPEDVNFVLLNCRGLSALKSLPHTAGIFNNTDDPSVIIRGIKAINGEIRRRMNVFANSKDLGIYDSLSYMKYRKAHPELNLAPMPDLIVIIDEFAEFRYRFPEFDHDIGYMMRLGRSVGINVILSMQYPVGVIKVSIEACLSFRICMKTASPADSKDILGTEDAFRLTAPGRAVIKTSPEKLVQVQTFYSDAPLCTSDNTMTQQIEGAAIVQEIIRTAETHNIPPARRICPEPLPKIIPLDRLIAGHEAFDLKAKKWTQKNSGLAVTAGIVDAPEKQRQYPFVLDFMQDGHQIIFGEASSGKTSFLQTVILSAAMTYTPEQVNFVILDYGSNVLNMFETLPHTVIAPARDEEKLAKANDFLLSELETRGKRFSAEGAANLEAYCEAVGEAVPAVIVVADNIAALNDYSPKMIDTLNRIANDGKNVGIYLMISALNDSGGYMYKISQHVKGKHTLQMTEKTDYRPITGSEIGRYPGKFKGRGLAHGGLEYQAALYTDGADESERLKNLKALCAEMSSAWTRKTASLETAELEAAAPAQPEKLTFTENSVQIGAKKGTREPVEFVFREMNGCVITGTNGSGKSRILGMIAQALDNDPNTTLYIYEHNAVLEKLCPNARVMHEISEADKVIDELADEFDGRTYGGKKRIALCIDDFYEFYRDISQDSADILEVLANREADRGIYIYVSCSAKGLSVMNCAGVRLLRSLLAKGNAIVTGGRLSEYLALRELHQSGNMQFSEHEGVLIHNNRVIPMVFGLSQGIGTAQENTHSRELPFLSSARDMMKAAYRLDICMDMQQVIIDDVEKTINDILAVWQGDAREAFKAAFEEKIKDYKKCRQDFVNLSAFLREYSQAMALIYDDGLDSPMHSADLTS